MEFKLIRFVAGTLCSLLLVGCCFAGVSAPTDEALKRFLQTWDGDKTTRYIATFQDLNSDGLAEAIVYLSGTKWCGSGGCSALVLTPDGDTWKVVTKTTITRLPIRVLASESNGWQDISVWVQGGGIQLGYSVKLQFNGKTYPTNPSIPPARKLTGQVGGNDAITSGMPTEPAPFDWTEFPRRSVALCGVALSTVRPAEGPSRP